MEMDKKTLASMIDHAVLQPGATDADLEKGCEIAAKYQVASICVRPCDVGKAVMLLSGTGVPVGTVIGFPHGANETAVKLTEAELALDAGAIELDMVLNIGRLRSGDTAHVWAEIAALAATAHRREALLKVILETCYLTDDEIELACRVSEAAGADFVKTSTGFGTAGAKAETVALMRRSVSPDIGVKASGGIRTYDDAIAMVNAGANRIGTASTAAILGAE